MITNRFTSSPEEDAAGEFAPSRPNAGTPAPSPPGQIQTTEDIVEQCLTEMVRYYRHSAVGRRCTGIIHNMNTPLQILSFQLELLEQKSQEELQYLQALPAPVADSLQAWQAYRREKLQQFSREVEDLQIMARRMVHQAIHENSQDLLYLDLNQIVQDELELYRGNLFFKHRVEKDFRFQPGLPPLYGYYIDFAQSFRLVVDNALEAMEEAPRRLLTVETSLEEDRRVVCIGDTGTGIPSEIFPWIFKPFVTTKSTAHKPRAGLGLFMVKRLLSPYQGQIRVTSRPGDTRVTISFPR